MVSCIDTSTICPRPVRSRWNRAALIAANRWMPPEKSTNAAPALVGGPSGSPVADGATGHRLHRDVHGGHVRVGPGGPVALAGGHDQARVVRQEPLRAELQALHRARRVVLDEHVGGLDQVEQRLAAGVGLQVEHHAALVGVEHHELVGLDRLVRAEAQWLTAGRLDLDDVGAQLCEQQPAVGAVVDLAQFEDPDAVEGRHVASPVHLCARVSGTARRELRTSDQAC